MLKFFNMEDQIQLISFALKSLDSIFEEYR